MSKLAVLLALALATAVTLLSPTATVAAREPVGVAGYAVGVGSCIVHLFEVFPETSFISLREGFEVIPVGRTLEDDKIGLECLGSTIGYPGFPDPLVERKTAFRVTCFIENFFYSTMGGPRPGTFEKLGTVTLWPDGTVRLVCPVSERS